MKTKRKRVPVNKERNNNLGVKGLEARVMALTNQLRGVAKQIIASPRDRMARDSFKAKTEERNKLIQQIELTDKDAANRLKIAITTTKEP